MQILDIISFNKKIYSHWELEIQLPYNLYLESNFFKVNISFLHYGFVMHYNLLVSCSSCRRAHAAHAEDLMQLMQGSSCSSCKRAHAAHAEELMQLMQKSSCGSAQRAHAAQHKRSVRLDELVHSSSSYTLLSKKAITWAIEVRFG